MSAGVIIDTSVWIDFFRGKLTARHKEALVLLLEADEVVITDVIKHELLVGASSKKDFHFLSDSLSALTEISLDSNAMTEFNSFGFELKLIGLLGKYTDLSIAFLAQKKDLPVFSFDQYFAKLARKNIISLFGPIK